MIEFRQGWVESTATGKKAPIMVKANDCVGPLDMFISYTLVLGGMGYLGYKAFKNGAKAFDRAETKALKDIGCITD